MRKKLELKPAFVERMQKLLEKSDFEKYIKSLEQDTQVSIRCNTLKITPSELKKRLENKNWKISQLWKNNPEVFVIEGKFIGKEEADEIEKRLMVKRIGINIRKDFDDKKVDYNKTLKKVSELTINNKFVSEANLVRGGGWESNNVLINLEPGELGRALEHMLGYYYIQDLASMLPVLVLEPKPGELILDMCASPGSKTTQMSSFMKNKGTIIANEVSLGRIKILASNTERCGCSNTIITRKDGIALCKRFKNMSESASFGGNEKWDAEKGFLSESLGGNKKIRLDAESKHQGFLPRAIGGKEKLWLDAGSKTRRRFLFDKILVDAPCSGEGTLRSSPKTSIMWNPKTITSLSKLQKSMVESALEILKPYGVIVYSTCTHAPEENEEVLDYILSKYPNIKIEKISLPVKTRPGLGGWGENKFNPEVKKSCRIYPHDTGTEGFFVAKLRKEK